MYPKLDCWAALNPQPVPGPIVQAGCWQYRNVLPEWGPKARDWPTWGELAGDAPFCLVLPSWLIRSPHDISAFALCLPLHSSAVTLPEGHTLWKQAVSWDRPSIKSTVYLSEPPARSPVPHAFSCLPGPECSGKREQAAFSSSLTH